MEEIQGNQHGNAECHTMDAGSADHHKVAGSTSDPRLHENQSTVASYASKPLVYCGAGPSLPADRLNSSARPYPKPPGQGVPGSWTLEEDAVIIAMHDRGETWDEVSRHLTGRSGTACRFRYVFLRHRPEWNEKCKDQVAIWYQRYKLDLWAQVADKVHLSARDAEALAWQLGPWEMARRGVVSREMWRVAVAAEDD